MISKKWRTSPREYDVVTERDIEIPVGDGISLVGDLFRPDTDEEVPVILGIHQYNKEFQSAPIKPKGNSPQVAWIEAGDPNFFARRGYAHAIVNIRGTGKSEGEFGNFSDREVEDTAEVIEWLADQSWCRGTVGMFGVSSFAIIQQKVATMCNPEPLDAIFAPWAATNLYRDWYYHGGIFAHEFTDEWRDHIDNPRCYSWTKRELGEEAFEEAIEEALADEEIRAVPRLVEALNNPEEGTNPLLVDAIVNNLDVADGYFDERAVSYENTEIPAYIGADWSNYALHLSGAFRSWRNWNGPKRMIIGPPLFVDCPLYQLQYESLRWFDHWLKGEETGIMDEPPIRMFVMNTGDWKPAEEWPLPETKWTPFYLHDDNLLFEREYWPEEGTTSFEDSPFRRETVTFETPELVENTEVIGPILLDLYASTTSPEALFIVVLSDIGPDGEETEITRGWLRGSQRKVDEERSEPWEVYHPHDEREPLEPGTVHRFQINVKPTATLFEAGHRIGLTIKGADPETSGGWREVGSFEREDLKTVMASGHLSSQRASRVTIHHNETHPSRLLLPVTSGNVLGTYYSGTSIEAGGVLPYEKIMMEKSVDSDQ